jgi:hypothetical protein
MPLITFSFWLEKLPRHLEPSDIYGPIDPAWSSLLLFAAMDHSDGGGAQPFLCVDENTGRIHGLDLERDSGEVFLFNSSAEQFIATFALLDSAIRLGETSLEQAAARIEAMGEAAFRDSEWRLLIEYLRSGYS